MILHIPHAHAVIPPKYRQQFLLDDTAMSEELRLLTDWYTHELFQFEKANVIDFPFSRFFVDVERFENDLHEPMAMHGMGRFYTRTIDGQPLRQLSAQDKQILDFFYQAHHQRLWLSVIGRIKTKNKALIVDCHSFPDNPMPCELDRVTERPDICLGYDEYHFDETRITELKTYFESKGYSVKINEPFAGSIVPAAMYLQLDKIQSVMIEVNRKLYMNEQTLQKTTRFKTLKTEIHDALKALHYGYPPMWGNPGSGMVYSETKIRAYRNKEKTHVKG